MACLVRVPGRRLRPGLCFHSSSEIENGQRVLPRRDIWALKGGPRERERGAEMESKKKKKAAAAARRRTSSSRFLPPRSAAPEALLIRLCKFKASRKRHDYTYLVDLIGGALLALLLVIVFRALFLLNARQMRWRRRFGRHHRPLVFFEKLVLSRLGFRCACSVLFSLLTRASHRRRKKLRARRRFVVKASSKKKGSEKKNHSSKNQSSQRLRGESRRRELQPTYLFLFSFLFRGGVGHFSLLRRETKSCSLVS